MLFSSMRAPRAVLLAATLAAGELVSLSTQAQQTDAPASSDKALPGTDGAPPAAGPKANVPPSPTGGAVQLPEVVVRTSARDRNSAPPPTAVVAEPTSLAPTQLVPNVTVAPTGQTVSTLTRDRFKDSPLFSIADILQDSPGISVKQGNGPRDVGISIRGSNARNGFGVRNIVMFEDGFPVTQPDGLSRTDLTDAHAYGGVDVFRGPSSAMFGNYASGGAINFRTRRGGEINGFEYGIEAGSFSYLNNYLAIGAKNEKWDVSLFASDVRGDGYISHSAFNTQTVNLLGVYTPTSDDTFTFKFINNLMYGDLAIRLSLDQFSVNPFQRGCKSSVGPGCGSVSLFNNGYSGAKSNLTADQAGLHRDDRRTIAGLRWEHNFDKDTVWRSQLVFDDRNINQPTGTTSAVGDYPSYNLISDITQKGQIFGLDATHFIGIFYNTLNWSGDTINLKPGGNAALGRITQNIDGEHTNFGVRSREEVRFNEQWTGVAALGVERSHLKGLNTAYKYAPDSITTTMTDREFVNTAPELALLFKPGSEWQFRARVSTGYGTPTVGNLFVTPAGVAGNNTQLQAQKNLGYDLGVDWTPSKDIKVSFTGFYEFFRNELVSQSPGAGLLSYTFNAPASEHRGIEIAVDWRPSPGWRFTTAYTYNDQYYTEYTEQISAGAMTNRFNRAGNKIPGVSPNEFLSRLGHDQVSGSLQGWGSFVEYIWKDAFYMENGNLLKAPGYQLVNLNVHYNTDIEGSYVKGLSLFAEVKNLFDKTYVASANNISNTITASGLQSSTATLASATGSIYVGAPRTFVAGMKLKF